MYSTYSSTLLGAIFIASVNAAAFTSPQTSTSTDQVSSSAFPSTTAAVLPDDIDVMSLAGSFDVDQMSFRMGAIAPFPEQDTVLSLATGVLELKSATAVSTADSSLESLNKDKISNGIAPRPNQLVRSMDVSSLFSHLTSSTRNTFSTSATSTQVEIQEGTLFPLRSKSSSDILTSSLTTIQPPVASPLSATLVSDISTTAHKTHGPPLMALHPSLSGEPSLKLVETPVSTVNVSSLSAISSEVTTILYQTSNETRSYKNSSSIYTTNTPAHQSYINSTTHPTKTGSIYQAQHTQNASQTDFASQRNPQCSAKSSAWDSTYLTELITTSAGPNPFATYEYWSTAYPWRTESITSLGNPTTKNPNDCCGTCSIYWPDVSVQFWPQPSSNTACLADVGPAENEVAPQLDAFLGQDTRSGLSAVPAPTPTMNRRFVPVPLITPGPFVRRSNTSLPVTAVGKDGFIYTSPSIYLEIPTIDAQDDCGYVGHKYTSIRWSFAPEDISSVVPEDPTCWPALFGWDERYNSKCRMQTKAFDFGDLPCPPQSLRAWGGSTFIYNPEVSYAPMLAQPPQMKGLDPTWDRCVGNVGWDPFVALTPQAALATPTKTNRPITSPTAHPVAVMLKGSSPTGKPSGSSENQKEEQQTRSVASPSQSLDMFSPSGASSLVDLLPIESSETSGQETIQRSQQDSQTQLKLQALPSHVRGISDLPRLSIGPVEVGGQAIIFHPGDNVPIIGSHTLRPGSTVTLDDTPFVLSTLKPIPVAIDGGNDQAGAEMMVAPPSDTGSLPFVVAGSSTFVLSTPPADAFIAPTPSPLTIDSHTFLISPNDLDVLVDGLTVSAGRVYTANIEASISLTNGGKAVVGSKTIRLPTATPLPLAGADMIQGILVGVRTVLAGHRATVSGIVMSVATDGALVVGSSTIRLVEGQTGEAGNLAYTAMRAIVSRPSSMKSQAQRTRLASDVVNFDSPARSTSAFSTLPSVSEPSSKGKEDKSNKAHRLMGLGAGWKLFIAVLVAGFLRL